MADLDRPSPVERIKCESDYLRGHIEQELTNGSECFQDDTVQLLKHHGMYQQDDRDQTRAKGPDGQRPGKVCCLMVRVKIPGGKLTTDQLAALLDLCDYCGNGTLRITNRQDLQLHGVLKRNARQTIRQINQLQLTTLGACGDVARNVMCCPAPYCRDGIHRELQDTADRLSAQLLPRSRAYHDIWLADSGIRPEQLSADTAGGDQIEPIYGNAYLPRKFKAAIALASDNCTDLYTNDLGLVAICRNGRVAGYNVLVGGSLGMTPGDKRTFPALAQPMAFIRPDEVLDVATAIVRLYRDFGNRCDRKRARLKYLIADWGLARFKAEVERYYGRALAEADPEAVCGVDDHLGWHEQGDGLWFYGLKVLSGRIADRGELRLKSALRQICRTIRPGIRLTPQQNLLLTDLKAEDRQRLQETLCSHGVKLLEEITQVHRCSMACVALPTCPMAVTESERVLPALLERLEVELARLGLSGERFTLRMTGCPNGCGRPYNAEVGLVGRTAGKYAVYLGGSRLGNRLAFVYQSLVPLDGVVPALLPVLRAFKEHRQGSETLGDFCHRLGAEALRSLNQGSV